MYYYKMVIAVLLFVIPGTIFFDSIISNHSNNEELTETEFNSSDFKINILNDLNERNIDYVVKENGVIACCSCTPCNVYTVRCFECNESVTFQYCEDCYHGEWGSYASSLCNQQCDGQT